MLNKFLIGFVILTSVLIAILLTRSTAFYTNLDNYFGFQVYRVFQPFVHYWRLPVFDDYVTDTNMHLSEHYSIRLNSELNQKSRQFYLNQLEHSLREERPEELSDLKIKKMLLDSVILADWERLRILSRSIDIDFHKPIIASDFQGKQLDLSKYALQTHGVKLSDIVETQD